MLIEFIENNLMVSAPNAYVDTNRVIFFPKLWNGKLIFCLGRTFDVILEAFFS